MHSIQDPRIAPVVDFGQLPEGIIFREVREITGCSLENLIQAHSKGTVMNIEEMDANDFSNKSKEAGYIGQGLTGNSSQKTLFSEVEAIDLTLKIVHLLELIHEKELIHTNLCPSQVFLQNKDVHSMCFTSLYHCVGDALANLGLDGTLDLDEDISKFDTRTRDSAYISPEQVSIGKELQAIGEIHNGKIDEKSSEV
jgi:serine/threonine protein kinase